MAPRGKNVCGIEITKDNISIAQYSAAEHAVSFGIDPRPLDDTDSSGDFFSVLKARFKKLAAQMHCEGQPAAVAVPSNFAVVKKLMIDPDEKDVRGAIGWELGQHIIGTLDDYSYDFEAMTRGGGTDTLYLAVAYRSANIQKLVSVLKAGKVVPCLVDLDIFALIDVFEANYRDSISSPGILIHGGEESSKLVLTSGGTFIDFEIVEHPARKAADTYAMQMRESAARCFPAAKNAPVFLTGTIFSDADFADDVCSHMGGAQILNPFTSIKCMVEIPENDVNKCISQLSVAVGLALRGAAEVNE
jgi:Tfp pilus assembly PilM family ATPase